MTWMQRAFVVSFVLAVKDFSCETYLLNASEKGHAAFC